MVLRTALECHKRIVKYRRDLYKLAKVKGISHINVIDLSKKLDKEIILLQKIMQEVRPIWN
ncbi:aspartyl-phosphate phosphatase Spo0E family protein [Neobacillus mesonae]|uniref:aspartyl-phosphate phosphatase Spo0E family protein n=1 Tax=Neobacillus mesonae TaxID=1193713 RepID=UPI0037C69874